MRWARRSGKRASALASQTRDRCCCAGGPDRCVHCGPVGVRSGGGAFMAADSDGPDSALGGVVREGDASVTEDAGAGWPALRNVVD